MTSRRREWEYLAAPIGVLFVICVAEIGVLIEPAYFERASLWLGMVVPQRPAPTAPVIEVPEVPALPPPVPVRFAEAPPRPEVPIVPVKLRVQHSVRKHAVPPKKDKKKKAPPNPYDI